MKNYFYAGVLIQKEDKYLLIQEAKREVAGTWNYPAGRVDPGETVEEAAIRETYEESGYQVELVKSLGEWPSTVTPGTYRKLFLGKIIGGELQIQADEILDAKWCTLAEIYAMKHMLRDDWVLKGLEVMAGSNLAKD